MLKWKNKQPINSPLKEIIIKTADAIKEERYDDAMDLLREGASIDMENPVLFNLLGILYENQRNYTKATRFYRVAYYIDPTFRAAEENLNRISVIFNENYNDVCWGLDFIGG